VSSDRLRRLRLTRGECPDCGKVMRDCVCWDGKTAHLTQDDVDTFHQELKGQLKQANIPPHCPTCSAQMTRNRGLTVTYFCPAGHEWHADENKLWPVTKDAEGVKRWGPDAISGLGKTAAVDPIIRVTGKDPMNRGDEIHAPLLHNPFSGTPQAPEFENGYQFAQQTGHQVLGQASLDDINHWRKESLPWRRGFVQAASYLGVQHPIELVLEDTKTAMATENLDGAASGAELPDTRESPMPEIHPRQRIVHGKFRVVGGEEHKEAMIRFTKTATDLTTEHRNELPTGEFALPGRRYPIHDEAHARNALARVAQHGSPEEKSRVRAAVHRRYPGIHEEKTAMSHIIRFDQMTKQAGVGDAVRGAAKSVKQVGKTIGKHFSGGSSGTGLGHVFRAGRKLVGGFAMMHGARRATKALENERPLSAAVHGAGAAVAGHLGGLTNTEKLIAGGIGAYRGHREAKKEKAEKEKKDEGEKKSCWATEYFKQAEVIVGGPSQGSRVRDALMAGAGLAGAAGGGLLLGHEIGEHNPLLAAEAEGALSHGLHDAGGNEEFAMHHPGAVMGQLGGHLHDSMLGSRDQQPMADMVAPLPAHLRIPVGGHSVSP
jgi:hypothetical protein